MCDEFYTPKWIDVVDMNPGGQGVWVFSEDQSEILYVPTVDGKFEEWMDDNDPTWKHGCKDEIEFLRKLWAAARLPRLIRESA